jgi:hypothetical protein
MRACCSVSCVWREARVGLEEEDIWKEEAESRKEEE